MQQWIQGPLGLETEPETQRFDPCLVSTQESTINPPPPIGVDVLTYLEGGFLYDWSPSKKSYINSLGLMRCNTPKQVTTQSFTNGSADVMKGTEIPFRDL